MPVVLPGSRQVIRAHGLTKARSEEELLNNLTLNVVSGEIFGLVGPPGAGKSLALACLAGLEKLEAGHLRILDFDPALSDDEKELRKVTGVMPQRLGLPGSLQAGEIISVYEALYQGATPELAQRLGLDEFHQVPIHRLDRFQRQRLSLTLALRHEPRLLFLDEPTTGLTEVDRKVLWREIEHFRQQGGTVVLATPVVAEAEQYCDTVALLDHGEVIAQGCPRQLLDKLRNSRRIVFQVHAAPGLAGALRDLRALPTVVAAIRHQERIVVIGQGQTLVPSAVGVLAEHAVEVIALQTDLPSLGDLFVSLTGRSWGARPSDDGQGKGANA